MPNRVERELQKRLAAMTEQEREEYFEQERLEKIKRSYVPPEDSWPNRRQVGVDEKKNAYLIETLDDDFHMILGVYFVNNSNETIRSVTYQTGGWLSAGDEVLPLGNAVPRRYEDVRPGEAVRFDFYDMVLDSDYMMQRFVKVILRNGDVLELADELKKGAPSGELKPV